MPQVKAQVGMTELGETAGKIWERLQRNGKSTLTELETKVESPKALTHMALGWLAREGKLDFCAEGRAVKIWLRE